MKHLAAPNVVFGEAYERLATLMKQLAAPRMLLTDIPKPLAAIQEL
jgi:hypothetical protein